MKIFKNKISKSYKNLKNFVLNIQYLEKNRKYTRNNN